MLWCVERDCLFSVYPLAYLNKSSAVAEMGDRLAKIDGPERRGCCPPFRVWEELGPRLTQCRLGRGLQPHQVVSWYIQPFRHNTPTLQRQRSDNIGRTVFVNCRPSVCRLSVSKTVTFVYATQPVEIFRNFPTPLATLAINWHSPKILRWSSQGNPSVVDLNAEGQPIIAILDLSKAISEMVQDRR